MTSRHLTQLMSRKSPSTFEVTLLTWCVIFYWGLLFGLWVNAWDTTLITSFIILDLKVRPVWHRSSCLLSLQVWGPLNYKCACDQKMTSGKRSKYIRNEEDLIFIIITMDTALCNIFKQWWNVQTKCSHREVIGLCAAKNNSVVKWVNINLPNTWLTRAETAMFHFCWRSMYIKKCT